MKKCLLWIGAVLLLCAPESVFADSKERKATAEIISCSTFEPIGKAILSERRSDEGVKLVDITVIADELSQGKHAVHIHEVGACSPCAAAGGHFDPGPAGLSNPDGNHPFHSGDLVNLEVNGNGKGVMHTTTSRITLSSGPLSVFDTNGSAIVVHAAEDTYCPDGPTAGCAGGARAACGVIVAD